MTPSVRNSVEIMKLANTPVADAVPPSERMSTQTVAASSSTIASWRRIEAEISDGLRTSGASASPSSRTTVSARGRRASARVRAGTFEPESTSTPSVSVEPKTTKRSEAATMSALACPCAIVITTAAARLRT